MRSRSHTTAEAVLQRLLLVLPRAAREEGAAVAELARELEVDPRQILRDLEEFEARNFYLPAGLGDQFQLSLTREHLSVWTTGEFKRPVRLSPREALALELALRVVGRTRPTDDGAPGPGPGGTPSAGGPSASFHELRRRVVEALRTPNAGDVEDPAVVLGGAEAGEDRIREAVETAVRNDRELRIVYGGPGREPEPRRVGPLTLAHAEGHWYLLARDLERDGHRAFRLDRTLEAEETGVPFSPTDRDRTVVESFFQDGRIHDGGGPDAPEPFEAVVEYSPGIARWIAERGWAGAERVDGGALRVRHRVVDPDWLVRHVLSYGAEARVVEPDWVAEQVVRVVEEWGG